MRAVIQRVRSASVRTADKIIGKIGCGILVFLGIEKGDSEKEVEFVANKIVNLRIFPDQQNKMNLNVMDITGEILSISQFTLASHIKKGRRPDFTNAEDPLIAKKYYILFNEILSRYVKVEKGEFGAMMDIESVNYGPVTFIISKNP